MLLLLSTICFAEENFILEIGEPVEVRSAGAWIRTFPTDDGWVATLGSNQSFYIGDLRKTGDGLADWEMTDKRQIVSQTGLIDHGIRRCPDGTYLHAASAMLGGNGEQIYLWHYNSAFEVISSATMNEGNGTHAHNDPNVLCSDEWKGVALSILGFDFQTDFFSLNDDLSLDEIISMADYPRGNGGGSLVNSEGDILYFGMSHGNPLQVNRYDGDWNFIEGVELPLVELPLRAYWPQGIVEVGDYYLVVHMAKDDAWQGSDKGDVFLAILTKDLQLVQTHRITTYENGEAAMRPWIARQGEQALISFDAFNEQMIVELKLNLDALGDDGSASSNSNNNGKEDKENEENEENSEKTNKCGCAEAEASFFVSLFLVSLFRRKRH